MMRIEYRFSYIYTYKTVTVIRRKYAYDLRLHLHYCNSKSIPVVYLFIINDKQMLLYAREFQTSVECVCVCVVCSNFHYSIIQKLFSLFVAHIFRCACQEKTAKNIVNIKCHNIETLKLLYINYFNYCSVRKRKNLRIIRLKKKIYIFLTCNFFFLLNIYHIYTIY